MNEKRTFIATFTPKKYKMKKLPKKRTNRFKFKKEKERLNDESFIDAYFIPRAKSVRCWTRKKKENGKTLKQLDKK